jgi:hypothetical protein
MDFDLFVEENSSPKEMKKILDKGNAYDVYSYLLEINAVVVSTEYDDMVYLFKRSLNDPSVTISKNRRKIGHAPVVETTDKVMNLDEYIDMFFGKKGDFRKGIIPPIPKQYLTQLLNKSLIVVMGDDDIHRLYLFNRFITV